MYAETQLGGIWFPSRIMEQDINLYRSTIIWSPQAYECNVIGTDVTVPKERARLKDEPDYVIQCEQWKPYGNVREKSHKRYLSALPENQHILLIKPPEEMFEGIKEYQIDLLDGCIGKLMQYCGKINATWEPLMSNDGIQIWSQNLANGTKRYQARMVIDVPIEVAERLLIDERVDWEFSSQKHHILYNYNKDFIIERSWIGSTSFLSPRDYVGYLWKVKIGKMIFRVRCSLEDDDQAGCAKLDPNFVRITRHPGCGIRLKPIGPHKTEFYQLNHVDIGGWVPLYVYNQVLVPKWFESCKKLKTHIENEHKKNS